MGCTGVLKRAQPGFQFANVKVSNSRVSMLMRIIIHAKCPRLQRTGDHASSNLNKSCMSGLFSNNKFIAMRSAKSNISN
jgi:hypothetical protein